MFSPRARPEEPGHPFRWSTIYMGLVIDIETDKGEYRTGTSPDGTPWSHRLPYPYGEVRGSLGADGDPVDVYLGPHRLAPYVYVIQTKFPGEQSFDETKSMIGFRTQRDAEAAFRSCYEPGFHLDTVRWPAASWVEAMARPGVSSSEMGSPLEKAHDLEKEVKNRSIDEWRWISDLDPDDAWPIFTEIGAKRSQFEQIETKDGPKLALVNGAIGDLDSFVSKHRSKLKLLRMDPETGGILRRIIKSAHVDQLPGGKADEKQPEDFDADALAEGTAHEREHTNKRALAREIAMDHLAENDRYYEQLAQIEKAKRAGLKLTIDPRRLKKGNVR